MPIDDRAPVAPPPTAPPPVRSEPPPVRSGPARGADLDEWLEYIARVHPQEIEMGLERVRAVAEHMNLLVGRTRGVIVAGTNGKGSTCTCLESILLAHGLTVGCTLSPHLHRFNERIRVGGAEVSDERIVAAFEQVEHHRGSTVLTYFEFAALAALSIFRSAEVDVAVLEVGLGGRLDAFNVVDCELAIITSIGIDHVEYLGNDVESIGREKAGVMRDGQVVILGSDMPSSVTLAAERRRARVSALGVDIGYTVASDRWSVVVGASTFPDLPVPRLPAGNCALAIAAAVSLIQLERDPLARALATVTMPGRLERVVDRGRTFLLDVAHNPHGAAFLARELLARGFSARGRTGVTAVYGALRDKDARGVVAELAAVVDRWVLAPTLGPRGCDAATLAVRTGLTDAPLASDVATALEVARSLADPAGVILVFGSFAVVERARLALDR